jgi:hypothetical protein
MAYAACGLLLSAFVHFSSFFGVRIGGQGLFFALHVGIFPLWLPVVLIANERMRGEPRDQFWRTALSGCPIWLKYLTYSLFVYAILNFAWFFIFAATSLKQQGRSAPPSAVWHGFSGHWMVFYCTGLAVLTAAYRRLGARDASACANGHIVNVANGYCRVCGAYIAPERTSGGD